MQLGLPLLLNKGNIDKAMGKIDQGIQFKDVLI